MKDEMFVVHCGPGSQRLRWLADVAIHRFDSNFAMDTGLMAELKFENGVQLNIDGMISEELADDVHVYVVLYGKFEFVLHLISLAPLNVVLVWVHRMITVMVFAFEDELPELEVNGSLTDTIGLFIKPPLLGNP